MMFNSNKIITFQEVFNYIIYDLDESYALSKGEDGVFHVNKLSVGPDFVQYKTECHELEKGIYERVQKLYDLLQETPRNRDEKMYKELLDKLQTDLDKDNLFLGSFDLTTVPREERDMLVKHFKDKGYLSYLYKDNKYIRILKKYP